MPLQPRVQSDLFVLGEKAHTRPHWDNEVEVFIVFVLNRWVGRVERWRQI